MGKHTKMYSDFESMLEASDVMDEFQLLHNILRNDFIELLSITEQFKDSKIEFETLGRSCLIQLFTLIEADIFGLGRLDPYPITKPKENFFEKFNNTFNQIATTWGKIEIKEDYFTNCLPELMTIKSMRNKLVHPSKVVDVYFPTFPGFVRLRTAFHNYNEFMGKIMNDFFIGAQFEITGEQLQEMLDRKAKKGIQLETFQLPNWRRSPDL